VLLQQQGWLRLEAHLCCGMPDPGGAGPSRRRGKAAPGHTGALTERRGRETLVSCTCELRGGFT